MPAAYQDENGKWFKQCSKTGTLFGPVDNREDLSKWFDKDFTKKDKFYSCCKVYKKKYLKTSSGILTQYKHRAKVRGINFTLTQQWYEEQMTKPEFNVCYYSGINFVDEPNHAFSRSLDRISSTKGYTPDNVRWVCFKLNSWKSDLTLDEIAIMFNAIAKHHNINPFEVLKKVVDT